jgi:hypothetical protein
MHIMPLKKGASQSVVSSNIKTLVDDWKKDGSIGTSHPPTKKRAIKQAVAIALTRPARAANRSHTGGAVTPTFVLGAEFTCRCLPRAGLESGCNRVICAQSASRG